MHDGGRRRRPPAVPSPTCASASASTREAAVSAISARCGASTIPRSATVERLPQPRILELDLIRVKGRKRPTRIYTMLDALGAERAVLDRLAVPHGEFLKAYRGRH